jgi:hypothetical protein
MADCGISRDGKRDGLTRLRALPSPERLRAGKRSASARRHGDGEKSYFYLEFFKVAV